MEAEDNGEEVTSDTMGLSEVRYSTHFCLNENFSRC